MRINTLWRIFLISIGVRNMSQLVRSPKQLGAALRRFRRSRRMTQADLAKDAGIRQGTVSQVEGGLETVKLRTVMDILRTLDLELVVQPRTKGNSQDIEDIF